MIILPKLKKRVDAKGSSYRMENSLKSSEKKMKEADGETEKNNLSQSRTRINRQHRKNNNRTKPDKNSHVTIIRPRFREKDFWNKYERGKSHYTRIYSSKNHIEIYISVFLLVGWRRRPEDESRVGKKRVGVGGWAKGTRGAGQRDEGGLLRRRLMIVKETTL